MSAHELELERRLAEVRTGAEPTADDKERVLAKVRSAISAAPLPAASAPMLRHTPSGEHLRYGLRAGTVFGLLGLVGGFWLGRSTQQEPSDALTPVSISSTSKTEASPPALELPAPKSLDAPSPAEPPPAEAHQASQISRSLPRVTGKGGAAVKPARRRPFTLADGLELLAQAERALHDDDPALALAVLRDFDRRAPRAILRQERLTTLVLASCGTRDTSGAREAHEQLQREFPNSIYARRLERACVDAAPGARPDTLPANLEDSGH